MPAARFPSQFSPDSPWCGSPGSARSTPRGRWRPSEARLASAFPHLHLRTTEPWRRKRRLPRGKWRLGRTNAPPGLDQAARASRARWFQRGGSEPGGRPRRWSRSVMMRRGAGPWGRDRSNRRRSSGSGRAPTSTTLTLERSKSSTSCCVMTSASASHASSVLARRARRSARILASHRSAASRASSSLISASSGPGAAISESASGSAVGT